MAEVILETGHPFSHENGLVALLVEKTFTLDNNLITGLQLSQDGHL